MKRVRNYLREVLEMKSREDWLKFEENLNFCGWESRSAQRQMILKTDILNPLKIAFFCISQVSREPIREMCRCIGQIFANQVWVAKHSRGTRETLYLKFLRNENFLRISQLETTHEGNHDFQSRNGQNKVFQH